MWQLLAIKCLKWVCNMMDFSSFFWGTNNPNLMVWIIWQTRTIPIYNEYIVLVSLIFGREHILPWIKWFSLDFLLFLIHYKSSLLRIYWFYSKFILSYLERRVVGSFITITSAISPNFAKCSFSPSANRKMEN